MEFRTEYVSKPPVDESEELFAQPNTALLSTILMLGTFFISYFLKEFRNSVFLGEKVSKTNFSHLAKYSGKGCLFINNIVLFVCRPDVL